MDEASIRSHLNDRSLSGDPVQSTTEPYLISTYGPAQPLQIVGPQPDRFFLFDSPKTGTTCARKSRQGVPSRIRVE